MALLVAWPHVHHAAKIIYELLCPGQRTCKCRDGKITIYQVHIQNPPLLYNYKRHMNRHNQNMFPRRSRRAKYFLTSVAPAPEYGSACSECSYPSACLDRTDLKLSKDPLLKAPQRIWWWSQRLQHYKKNFTRLLTHHNISKVRENWRKRSCEYSNALKLI